MENFEVYIDETGNIADGKADDIFGFGTCISEVSPKSEEITRILKDEFPEGIHFKNLSQTKKLETTIKVTEIARRSSISISAMIVNGIAELRHIFGNNLARFEDKTNKQREQLKDIIKNAPVGSNGIVKPEEIFSETLKNTKMQQVYIGAFRLPVLQILQNCQTPENAVITLNVGIVGQEKDHVKILEKILPSITKGTTESLHKFVRKGLIPSVPLNAIRINLVDGNQESPLFWLADLAAGVCRQYAKYSKDNNHISGKQIYEAARELFFCRNINQKSLTPGIYFE